MRDDGGIDAVQRVQRVLRVLAFGLAVGLGCQQPSDPGHGASARCATCHMAEFDSVSHPPHAGVRPTTCGACHLDASWHPFRLNHSWPLEGAHAKADCFQCHAGTPAQFEGTTKACLGCHQTDDQKANAQVAHHREFPTTCETCHTTAAWKPTLPHAEPGTEARAVESSAPALGSARPAATAALNRKPASSTPTQWPSTPAPKGGRVPDSVSGASPVRRK